MPRWLSPFQFVAGRTGRGLNPPPQFGHTLPSCSTQARQNVHSKLQIIASVDAGGSVRVAVLTGRTEFQHAETVRGCRAHRNDIQAPNPAIHASGASSSSPSTTNARSSSEPANGASSASARANTASADAPAAQPGVEVHQRRRARSGATGHQRRPRQPVERGHVLPRQVDRQLARRIGDDVLGLGNRRLHLRVRHATVHGRELVAAEEQPRRGTAFARQRVRDRRPVHG